MEFSFKKNEIIINNKKLNNLDKFVLDFLDILKKYSDYVIVSGYVSIFFGRSRATEDVDILIPKMNKNQFSKLFSHLIKKYWFINTDDENELYNMLKDNLAIRIGKKKQMMPNIELKFISNMIHNITFKNKIRVVFDSKELFFSPLEIQIIYKGYLGSEKDLLDAILLFEIFRNHLNTNLLVKYSKYMNVKKILLKKIFGEIYEKIFDKRIK